MQESKKKRTVPVKLMNETDFPAQTHNHEPHPVPTDPTRFPFLGPSTINHQ